jgi:hypothetical protein
MPRKGKGAAPGHRERVAERQADAMRLRVAGASFAQIARQLGVSKQQAFRDTRRALDETLAHRDGSADSYRELELSRLDALLVACWKFATAGSAEHVRACVRIAERRARLLGLDASVRQQIEMKGGPAIVVNNNDNRPYENLSDAEIVARLDRARESLRQSMAEETLRAMADNVALTPVENPPTPLEAYAARLAERERTRRSNH